MDGVRCVGLSEKPGRFAYGDPATQNNDDTEVEELAQRDWNQLDGLGRNPLVRLVLANFGGECKYAVKVAEQIRAYAEGTPSVVAVTGLGQSRETTQSALAVLGPSRDSPGDEYSSDLAEEFQGMLKPERHDYDETANMVTTKLGQVVTDICRKSPNPARWCSAVTTT